MIQSELLRQIPGIRHGFGSAAAPVPENFAADWDARPSWKQVHGVRICEVFSPRQNCGEVDGIYTHARATPIAMVSADCLPILLARRDGSAVAALHSGWRGTYGKIVREFFKEHTGEWVAAIGPSIGVCCYEVSEDLAQNFATQFGGPPDRMLKKITQAELLACGVREIDTLPYCTRCSTEPLFESIDARAPVSASGQPSLSSKMKHAKRIGGEPRFCKTGHLYILK